MEDATNPQHTPASGKTLNPVDDITAGIDFAILGETTQKESEVENRHAHCLAEFIQNNVLGNINEIGKVQRIYENEPLEMVEMIAKEVDGAFFEKQMGAKEPWDQEKIADCRKVCRLAAMERKMQLEPSDDLAQQIGYVGVELVNKKLISEDELGRMVKAMPTWHQEAALMGAYVGDSEKNDAKVSRLYAWKLAQHQRDPKEVTKDDLYLIAEKDQFLLSVMRQSTPEKLAKKFGEKTVAEVSTEEGANRAVLKAYQEIAANKTLVGPGGVLEGHKDYIEGKIAQVQRNEARRKRKANPKSALAMRKKKETAKNAKEDLGKQRRAKWMMGVRGRQKIYQITAVSGQMRLPMEMPGDDGMKH